MKRYLHLTCTTCRRSTDKLVDLTHYTPDQCTITLGCEGRLQPVQYQSNAGIAVPPKIGVTDWHPRGTKAITTKELLAPTLIDLSTGALKQLVIAVPDVSPALGTYDLTLNVQADTPKAYRQYVFRQEGAFSSISGVESGLEKKALRFTAFGTSPDMIEVYVNGVKRERGTDPEDYQLYNGTNTSAVPPSTVLFNSPIQQSGVAQVDIIVSKEQIISTVILTFKRNQEDESRQGLGAFENIDCIDRLQGANWRRYYLFTLDLAEANIPLNSIMVPQADSEILFLLARKPYTQLDRYTGIVLPLADMSAERDYIKYYALDSELTARVTTSALVPVFPPLRLSKFSQETTIKTATAGADDQVIIDGKVIMGPDA